MPVNPANHRKEAVSMPKRQGNNPKRRIAPKNGTDRQFLDRLAGQAVYIGSSHHKRFPADYGFQPPVNPRPNKSICDGSRVIKRAEATSPFREGIRRGMISTYCEGELPKYVWAVDGNGRVYEAKRDGDRTTYHGYELGDDESAMKKLVAKEWHAR